LSELAERFGSEEKARGEIVLLIDRTPLESEVRNAGEASNIAALVDAFEAEGMDHRAALKKAARELGLSRDEAYRRLVSERSK
jgi:16S rRNA (cytidine1402-2'-O)-methyltransferase